MLIPSNEVAEVIGVSRQSVLNYIRDGILTGSHQAETKVWFVTRESLEKYCQDMGTEFVD